jgi:hypothetical protein
MYNSEDYLCDDLSEVSGNTSSLNTMMKEDHKAMKLLKMSDPDYYSYKKLVNGKQVKVELYSTPAGKNALIRHAISGSKCQHRAGTNQEDLYYTVIDTAAPKNTEQYKNYGVRVLFYYSPEEYERHMNVKLSPETKENWQLKYMVANRRYNK